MRTFKVIAVLLTLFIVGFIIESCIKCEKVFSFEYSLSSFELHPMDSEVIMWITDDLLVFRKDFGVEIEFKADINLLANCQHFSSFFIQSAYAWSCAHDTYYPKDYIVSVQVFSNKDFDETHPAGSNVVEFFQIRGWGGGGFHSFEEFLKYPAPEFSNMSSFRFTCLTTATALEAGEYEFNFVVTLSDERVLEQSIKAVLE
jgi:hypothetical protein